MKVPNINIKLLGFILANKRLNSQTIIESQTINNLRHKINELNQYCYLLPFITDKVLH